MPNHLPLRPEQLPQPDVPILTRPDELRALKHSASGRAAVLDGILAGLPNNVDAKLARKQLDINLRELSRWDDYHTRMRHQHSDAINLLGGILAEDALPGELQPGDIGQPD